jgi:hypothetical protein
MAARRKSQRRGRDMGAVEAAAEAAVGEDERFERDGFISEAEGRFPRMPGGNS